MDLRSSSLFWDHIDHRSYTTDAQLGQAIPVSRPDFRDEEPPRKVSPAPITAERHDPCDLRIQLCCQIINMFQMLQCPNINVGHYG